MAEIVPFEENYKPQTHKKRKSRGPLVLGDWVRNPYMACAKMVGGHHLDERNSGVVSNRKFWTANVWAYATKHYPAMKKIYLAQTGRALTKETYYHRVHKQNYVNKERDDLQPQISTEHYKNKKMRKYLTYVTRWYAEGKIITQEMVDDMVAEIKAKEFLS